MLSDPVLVFVLVFVHGFRLQRPRLKQIMPGLATSYLSLGYCKNVLDYKSTASEGGYGVTMSQWGHFDCSGLFCLVRARVHDTQGQDRSCTSTNSSVFQILEWYRT
jgi:hypothetical protein